MNLKTYLLYIIFILYSEIISHAKVIHNAVSVGNYSTLDLNQDGFSDLQISPDIIPFSSGPFTCPISGTYNVNSNTFIFRIQGALFTNINLPNNSIIHSTTNFPFSSHQTSNQTLYNYTYSNSPALCGMGQIPDVFGSNSFTVGFKKVLNGLIHYGWLEVLNGKIVYYAYESIPGYPILMGDKIGYLSEIFNATANIISGKVYIDGNSNCVYDLGEKTVEGILVYTTTGNFGGITDINGDYKIYVPGGTANYSTTIQSNSSPGLNYQKNCPAGFNTSSFTGNNQTSSNKNFSININYCTQLNISVKSGRRRRCFRNTTIVTYQNLGINSSANSTVYVVMPQYVKAISSIPAWTSQSGDTLFYNTGILPPFSKNSIEIKDSVICGNESIRGLTQCTKAFITPKGSCASIANWDKSELRVSGTCSGSTFNAQIINQGINMVDSTSYRVYLDSLLVKTKKIKLNAGQICNIQLPLNGKSVHIEVDQNPYHPSLKCHALNFEGCGNFTTESISKGGTLNFPLTNGNYAEATDCQIIRDSYDPNDKLAIPAGFDTDNKILPNGEIEYTIRFQNTGNDEAYTVVVADTLDPNIEPGSFRMIAASHPYKLEMTGFSSPRMVWIFGGINLPDSTTNEPESHGFITYRVAQKANLSPGTLLKNKAHIYFDYNSAIITNEYLHTIHQEYPKNLLQINNQPANVVHCQTPSTNLTLTSSAAGYGSLNYQWYKGNGMLLGKTSNSFTITNPIVADTGSYKCRIENGIDTIFTNIAKYAINNPSIVLTNPLTICQPKKADLTLSSIKSGSSPGLTYSYFSDPNATIPLSNPSSISTANNYYIVGTDAYTCSDTATVSVAFNTQPYITFVNPDPTCFPNKINLTNPDYAYFLNPGLTFQYFTDANATIPVPNPTSVTSSGNYYVVGTAANSCTDTVKYIVTIYDKPIITVTNPDPVCKPSAVDLTAVSINTVSTFDVSYYYYEDANLTIPNLNPTAAQTSKTYYLLGIALTGCSDTATIEVVINEKPDLSVTDQTTACNSNADITSAATDIKNTTGTISYWNDLATTNGITDPTSIAGTGNATYYIKKVTNEGCIDTKPVNVIYLTCSGTLDELANKYNLRFYPNPTTEYVIIESSVDGIYVITDNTGKEILSNKLTLGINSIETNALANGTYNLTFTIKDKKHTVNFVKK